MLVTGHLTEYFRLLALAVNAIHLGGERTADKAEGFANFKAPDVFAEKLNADDEQSFVSTYRLRSLLNKTLVFLTAIHVPSHHPRTPFESPRRRPADSSTGSMRCSDRRVCWTRSSEKLWSDACRS